MLLKFLFDYSGDLFPIATFHVVIKQEESFKIIKTINTIGKLCLFSRKHIWLQSIWSAQTQASIGMNNKLLETFCLLFAFYYLCFYLPYLTEGKMLFSIYICQFSSKIVNIFAISFGYDVVCVFLFCYLPNLSTKQPMTISASLSKSVLALKWLLRGISARSHCYPPNNFIASFEL